MGELSALGHISHPFTAAGIVTFCDVTTFYILGKTTLCTNCVEQLRQQQQKIKRLQTCLLQPEPESVYVGTAPSDRFSECCRRLQHLFPRHIKSRVCGGRQCPCILASLLVRPRRGGFKAAAVTHGRCWVKMLFPVRPWRVPILRLPPSLDRIRSDQSNI